MTNTDVAKATKKLSAQLTKDFTKLVKSFARAATKSGRANVAFVVGYMDASCGRGSTPNGIPDNNILDYSKGWQAGAKKEPTKRKNKRG